MADELARLDATAQADLVRTGEVTAAGLVEASIARIGAVNAQLNAAMSIGKTSCVLARTDHTRSVK